MDDLPVAVRPWMFVKGGEGRCAWLVSGVIGCIGKLTYRIQGRQMLNLLLATRKFACQFRYDLTWQHCRVLTLAVDVGS